MSMDGVQEYKDDEGAGGSESIRKINRKEARNTAEATRPLFFPYSITTRSAKGSEILYLVVPLKRTYSVGAAASQGTTYNECMIQICHAILFSSLCKADNHRYSPLHNGILHFRLSTHIPEV
jgi:hypothetical protein